MPANAIHPTAVRGRDVFIGPGSVMAAGSQVTTNIRIGCHVHLDRLVTVGHDRVISDFVSVYPGAVLSGGVTRDVADGSTVIGIPARPLG